MRKIAGNADIRARYNEFAAIAQEIVDAAHHGDLVGYLDADRRFHLGLLAYTTNHRLVSIVEGLRDHTRLFGLAGLSEQGSLVASADEHKPILDAIVAGDAQKVGALMLRHLEHIRGDWSAAAADTAAHRSSADCPGTYPGTTNPARHSVRIGLGKTGIGARSTSRSGTYYQPHDA
jgi:DNA-binding GntR family transcriptional regulator